MGFGCGLRFYTSTKHPGPGHGWISAYRILLEWKLQEALRIIPCHCPYQNGDGIKRYVYFTGKEYSKSMQSFFIICTFYEFRKIPLGSQNSAFTVATAALLCLPNPQDTTHVPASVLGEKLIHTYTRIHRHMCTHDPCVQQIKVPQALHLVFRHQQLPKEALVR